MGIVWLIWAQWSLASFGQNEMAMRLSILKRGIRNFFQKRKTHKREFVSIHIYVLDESASKYSNSKIREVEGSIPIIVVIATGL